MALGYGWQRLYLAVRSIISSFDKDRRDFAIGRIIDFYETVCRNEGPL